MALRALRLVGISNTEIDIIMLLAEVLQAEFLMGVAIYLLAKKILLYLSNEPIFIQFH